KTADIDQAAHRVRRKARAFLVGESDERQRPAGDVAHIVHGLARFKPGQDSIEAIIATAGRDGIDMRPEHHRRGVRTAGANADDVANGVDCDGKGELAHPFNKQIAPGAVLVAECEATIAAAGQGTDPVESCKSLEQPIAVDPRRCRHLMPSLCERQLTNGSSAIVIAISNSISFTHVDFTESLAVLVSRSAT